MRLVICENSADVADMVASYVVKRINDYKPTEARPFVLGCPTGSSPLITYMDLRGSCTRTTSPPARTPSPTPWPTDIRAGGTRRPPPHAFQAPVQRSQRSHALGRVGE